MNAQEILTETGSVLIGITGLLGVACLVWPFLFYYNGFVFDEARVRVLAGASIFLGFGGLVWPLLLLFHGFMFDAPADTISTFMQVFRKVAFVGLSIYPITFLISSIGGGLAYWKGASTWTLFFFALPSLLNPVPWEALALIPYGLWLVLNSVV